MKLKNVLMTLYILGIVYLLVACVSTKRYKHDVLAHYRKGLKVGRVIGRDEVLFKLKSADCFQQSTDELMNPSPMDKLAEESARATDKKFEAEERRLGILKRETPTTGH